MEAVVSDKIKGVYNRLQDHESRLVFRHRLMYFLDGDPKHINKIIFHIDQKPEKYERSFLRLQSSYSKNPKRIVLFGAGAYSRLISQTLNLYGIKADCYCDSDPIKQDTAISGLPVISPDTLLKDYRDSYIMISSCDFEDEIHLLKWILRVRSLKRCVEREIQF